MAEEKVLTQEQVLEKQEQTRLQAEQERLRALKVILTQTSSTPGWPYIKKIADNIVQGALQQSLNVADETESEQCRVKARVAREIFGQLFTVIETVLAFGTEAEAEWFAQLNAFEQDQKNQGEPQW
jgi:hypothetical protein